MQIRPRDKDLFIWILVSFPPTLNNAYNSLKDIDMQNFLVEIYIKTFFFPCLTFKQIVKNKIKNKIK